MGTRRLRLAVVNQTREGGGTEVARAALSWGPPRGLEVAYFPASEHDDPAGLAGALEEFGPDVVHAHCWYGHYDYAAIGPVGDRWPLAITLHDPFAVNQYGVECWECYRNPFCLGCPGLGPLRRWRPNHRILERLRKRRANRRLRAHLVLPSQWMRRRIARSELRRLPATVISNGVDLGRFRPGACARGPLGLPEGPLVLFCGHMYNARDHRKGLPDLLAAMEGVRRRVAGAALAVAGRVSTADLPEGVHVLGDVPRGRMPELYRAADVFCLPTLGDNQPLTVLEALASGLPVVATRTGGLPELVARGACGALVPPADRQALADALAVLLADPAGRARRAEAARERAERLYGLDRHADLHAALYHDLAGRRRAAPRPA